MIKRSIKLIVFLLILINFNCKNRKCNNFKEINIASTQDMGMTKIIDECNDNLLLKEQEYIKSSNGNLIPNGFHKEYYKDGHLKILGFYKNGIQDSLNFQYFPDGKIKIKSFMSEGQYFGPQYEYYDNSQLKSITYHKNSAITWFQVTFNEDGTINGFSGKALRVMSNPGYKNLKLGDKIGVLNEVPNIKNIENILHISLMSKNKIVVDTTIFHFDPLLNIYVYGFSKKVDKIGSYQYIASVKLIDKVSNKIIKEDTIILSSNVEK